MNRLIIVVGHDVYFDEDGLLIKAEFVTITDLIESNTEYVDLDKTMIGA